MPPQLSDDDALFDEEYGEEIAASASKRRKGKGKAVSYNDDDDDDEEEAEITYKPKRGRGRVIEDDDEEDGDEEDTKTAEDDEDEKGESDDEAIPEDVYVVEGIIDHLVDDNGTLVFKVKWEGYDDPKDLTWEPEENLETAIVIVDEYMEQFGGKDAVLKAWKEKKAESGARGKRGRKRGRESTGAQHSATNGNKKVKNSGSQSASDTPREKAETSVWEPPTGSWEDDVVGIDACEGNEGNVWVFLTWKNGHKSRHPSFQVYHRCPQAMLKFYESHLVFKRDANAGDLEGLEGVEI